MYYLYILKSQESGKYYIGETGNIKKRLDAHRKRKSSFGKRNSNLVLVYNKEFNRRSEAKKLESFLKRQKSRQFLDKLIAGKIIIPP